MTAGQRALEFLENIGTLRDIRVAARTQFADIPDLEIHLNYDEEGTDRYFWSDGAGNEANLLLNFQGEPSDAVLYVYEHESEFNTYSLEGEDDSPFDTAPEPYNQLKHDERLYWTWDKKAARVEATAVAWWDGDTWQLSSEAVEAMDDAGEDGGLTYCLSWLTSEQ